MQIAIQSFCTCESSTWHGYCRHNAEI